MSEYTGFDWNTLYQQAKNVSFEVLPIGDYQAQCVEANATHASTGKPMIKAKFKVSEGAFAGRSIMTQFVLSPDNETALSMFFRHMKAFGLDESFFARCAPGQLGPVAGAMVGKYVTLTLGHREWQGENRNEVKSVKPPLGATAGGATVTPMPGMPGAPMPGMPMPGMPMPGGMPPGMPMPPQPSQPPQLTVVPPAPVQPQVAPPQPPAPAQAPAMPASPPAPEQLPAQQPQDTSSQATPQVVRPDLPI